ncbi:MAG TPA: GTPase [Lachnospiraceae bacterium]|nr:GTPase [Lachnospiraceae bacterium]
MNKEIPVYVFMGFLGSGKTRFAKETLIDRSFTDGQKTLLLVCEDGEEEYDIEALAKKNIFVEFITEETLNAENLLNISARVKPELVMIEYNGMWELDRIFNIRVPKGWTVVQVLSFVDASTFDVYISNMKKIIMDQLKNADMIIFNRCDENTKKAEYRRSIRAVNRRAQVIFENKDGVADADEEEAELPFDTDGPLITFDEEDFGLFYIDAADNPDKYLGKKIKFKAMVHKPSTYGANEFVPGRFAMTCCAADVAFVGFKCYYGGAKSLKDRDWVIVEGTIEKEFYPEFEGDGPVIYADSVAKTSPAAEELVYFNY